ncbi:MAG: glycosyl hydrolase [Planctomycetota bacterium]|nr:glycosyl hydrolase [Planctomycetota bacterium]
MSTALLAFVFLPGISLQAPQQQDPPGPVPTVLLEGCDWREIGPFRGGRSAAVTGIVGDDNTYYFGACGGGVWKTVDAGETWKNVSDGFFGGSVGAVAVAPSQPDTVYVGGGEKTWRGNVSSGDGMWKSTDAGRSWSFIGLPESRHISRIRVDPDDPNLVYVAVMGHLSGPNEERGVYRSKDGGQTWEQVLFSTNRAGAVDLCLDPDDAQVLYASTWRAFRTPYSLESGGPGSALWKSTDGGDTWTDISDNDGLPAKPRGIIGVSVSGADSQRVYAMIEAPDGGLFRSEDAGATWRRVNEDRNLRQRAWYYTRCYADPVDKDTVYVLNVGFHKSTDGGKTFSRISVPHGDNHDLWIDPYDNQRMIQSNDGGANVSVNGGNSWTEQDQATAQFYRVTTDDAEPYRIYGAQQDNSTVRIASHGLRGSIGRDDWESTAGGESGWIAPTPGNPDIVYGGSYGGYLQRLDHDTRLSRSINVWPDNPMGAGAEAMKYRFQWNFPILFSPHDPKKLYTAANVLFQSLDEGQSWQPISPDLTRNDPTKLGSSGGPITQDNTGVEYYCTIFTVDESPLQTGTIWVGSDDGRVHLTRDGGGEWVDVTPPDLPEWAQINCIEADPHDPGGCYLAATRYKLDDFKPYIFVTNNHGRTWRSAVRGIDPTWFTRTVRADPVRRGLLYAGTERGVWVSFNDGWLWQKLQRNLPIVPITDLCIHGEDLIAATQGRSFWVFDHLHHLRQLKAEQAVAEVTLFEPTPFVQFPGGDRQVAGAGRNQASAPVMRFFVGGDQSAPVTGNWELQVLDWKGEKVWSRKTRRETAEDGEGAPIDASVAADDAQSAEPDEGEELTVVRGMNEVRFEPEYEGAKGFEGMILWAGRGLSGPRKPPPGKYRVRLFAEVDGEAVVLEQPMLLRKDPRTNATEEDLQEKFAFVIACRDTITAAHEAIIEIRALREQLDAVVERSEGEARQQLEAAAEQVNGPLREVEETLYQTKSKSRQDPLNYPIKLTDKLAGVMSAVNRAEYGPTQGQQQVKEELVAKIEEQLEVYRIRKDTGVADFNALALRLAVPYVK